MKTIQSIDRAITVLNYISENNNKLKLTDISEALGLKITTLHGIISTLEYWGFVSKNPENNRYCLGIRLYELGNVYGEDLSIKKIAEPYLHKLVDKFSETAHLAVLSDFNSVYVDKVESPHPIRMASLMGTKENLLDSTTGKIMLAYSSEDYINKFIDEVYLKDETILVKLSKEEIYCLLSEIRQNKYIVHYHAETNNFNCIAVCLTNSKGNVVGSINISIPSFRFSEDLLENIKTELLLISEEISHKI